MAISLSDAPGLVGKVEALELPLPTERQVAVLCKLAGLESGIECKELLGTVWPGNTDQSQIELTPTMLRSWCKEKLGGFPVFQY
jgi:hypothetical protein